MANSIAMGATAQLIPTFLSTIGGAPVMCCDARPLHAYLESSYQFADWIKARIDKYGFEQGVDYELASKNFEASYGGQNRTDYHLSLDMGKELAMVENNAKGREARKYFIACEKQAMGAAPMLQGSLPQAITPEMMISLLNGGCLDPKVTLDIALASSRQLFQTVCNTPSGYGQEVARNINQNMALADVHAIALASTMQLFSRSEPLGRPIATPASVPSFKPPKLPASERVLIYITKHGADGVAHRTLISGCKAFRLLDEQARDALLEGLIQDGSIVTARTKTGRALVFKAANFADLLTGMLTKSQQEKKGDFHRGND